MLKKVMFAVTLGLILAGAAFATHASLTTFPPPCRPGEICQP
jgi:hypothetical protein